MFTIFRPTLSNYLRISRLVVLAGVLVVVIGMLYGLWHGHYRLLSVQSNSMQPTFQKGDAVLVHPVALTGLRPGVIVSYHSPINPRLVISHRLVEVNRAASELTTKGDALQTADPAIPAENLVGQAVALVPYGGRILDLLHKPLGLAVFVYLPAVMVVGFELKRLLKHSSQKTYQRYGYR